MRPGATARRARAAARSRVAASGCGASSDPGQDGSRPNIVVIMTDDQTAESMRVMSGVRSVLGRARDHVRARVRLHRALLPLASHVLHRAVHAQPRCAGQPPARGRLRPPRYRASGCPSGSSAPATTRCTSASSSIATDRTGRRRRCRRAGASGTRRSTPRPTSSTATGSTRTAWSRSYPRYSTDEYAQRAVDAVTRLAPSPRPLLPLARLRRPAHRWPARSRRPGGPRDPEPGRASPRRLRGRAAAALAGLQRGRRVRQAELHPPAAAAHAGARGRRRGELPPGARVAARRRRGRREASSTHCAHRASWRTP